MYWSPRFCASLSATLSIEARSREMCTSPGVPSTFGKREIWSPRPFFIAGTLPPAFASKPAIPGSFCSTASRCCGSMYWLSWPSAMLCASARASCSLVVNLSNLIVLSATWGCAGRFQVCFLLANSPFRPYLRGLDGEAHPVQRRLPAVRILRHRHRPAVVAAGADRRSCALQRIREAPRGGQDLRGGGFRKSHYREAESAGERQDRGRGEPRSARPRRAAFEVQRQIHPRAREHFFTRRAVVGDSGARLFRRLVSAHPPHGRAARAGRRLHVDRQEPRQ